MVEGCIQDEAIWKGRKKGRERWREELGNRLRTGEGYQGRVMVASCLIKFTEFFTKKK